MSWQHHKTNYYVRAEAKCPIHNTHTLTGTGVEKSHIQPLITDVVADLPFYYSCAIEEVQGIYTGLVKSYKRAIGNKFEYKSDPIETQEKVYITKKVRR